MSDSARHTSRPLKAESAESLPEYGCTLVLGTPQVQQHYIEECNHTSIEDAQNAVCRTAFDSNVDAFIDWVCASVAPGRRDTQRSDHQASALPNKSSFNSYSASRSQAEFNVRVRESLDRKSISLGSTLFGIDPAEHALNGKDNRCPHSIRSCSPTLAIERDSRRSQVTDIIPAGTRGSESREASPDEIGTENREGLVAFPEDSFAIQPKQHNNGDDVPSEDSKTCTSSVPQSIQQEADGEMDRISPSCVESLSCELFDQMYCIAFITSDTTTKNSTLPRQGSECSSIPNSA